DAGAAQVCGRGDSPNRGADRERGAVAGRVRERGRDGEGISRAGWAAGAALGAHGGVGRVDGAGGGGRLRNESLWGSITSTVTQISQDDPDPSLFTIPDSYKPLSAMRAKQSTQA